MLIQFAIDTTLYWSPLPNTTPTLPSPHTTQHIFSSTSVSNSKVSPASPPVSVSTSAPPCPPALPFSQAHAPKSDSWEQMEWRRRRGKEEKIANKATYSEGWGSGARNEKHLHTDKVHHTSNQTKSITALGKKTMMWWIAWQGFEEKTHTKKN